MTDARAKWNELGDQLNELGLKLRLHFEQAGPEGGAEGDKDVREALRAVTAAVEQAFDAVGTAAKDDAVRTDVKEAGRAVVEALEATFAELGERFRSTTHH
jgi:hypothetical protein